MMRCVETSEAMRRALEEEVWDLIIADSILPDFSGPAALALVQEKELDVPFIVVSGGVGEETAVEIMRAGAQDFVTRDHMGRLVPAVQRELREAEMRRQRRRADQALRESEERYRVLVESSPEPIAVHSGGVLVFANPAAARLMGAPQPAALIGKPVLDFVHPDDRPLVLERIRRTQGEGRLASAVEERFVRLDGSVIHVETTALPTTFEGQPATQVVVRDVTARKRAESTLRFLAQASAKLSASLEYRATLRTVAQLAVPELGDWCLVDLIEPDGSFERVAVGCADPSQVDLARASERHYGPPASVGAEHGVTRVAHSVTTEVINDVTGDLLPVAARDPEHARLLEAMAFRSFVCAPLVAHDRVLGTLTLTSSQPHRYDRDTVALAEELARRSALALDNARLFELAQAEIAERSRAEAELRASRDQLEAILGGMADGALVQDAAGHFVYANDAAAHLAGFDSTAEYLDAMATDISAGLDVVDADGRAFDYEQLPARRALRGEEPAEMVIQFRRRDTGETRWSLTRSRAVTGADGQPLAISIFHDLTDRIGAEHQLRFLAEAGARLGMSLDERETLSAITELAVETLSDWAVVYVPEDGGKALRRSVVTDRDPDRVAVVRQLDARYPPRPTPHSNLWRVRRDGTPLRVLGVPDAMLVRVAEDPGHLRLLRALQLSSLLYVPLQARGRTLGVLGLFTTAVSGRRLSSEDLALVEEIGRRAALAVDNARLYAQAREAIRARDEFLSMASHE